MKSNATLLFAIFCWLLTTPLFAKAKTAGNMSAMTITELHKAAENVINYAQDSTYILLEEAQKRIACLPEGEKKAGHLGENHLRWADYYWAHYIPQSRYHLQKAFEYYRPHPNDKKLAEAYYVNSAIHHKEGHRELQMVYLDSSITYALRSGDPQLTSTIFIMQGFYLQTYQRWQESFDKAKLAVEYAKESGDSLPISASYFILAQIKEHFNQLDEAEELFEKSIAYGKGHYDMAGVYRGYGSVLFKNNKLEPGLKAFRHSMQLYSEEEKLPYVMLIRVRMGEALLSHGHLKEARANFQKALQLAPELPSNIHIHYLHFAKMYAHLKQLKNAHLYIDRFLETHQIKELKAPKVDLIKDLAEVYEILGQQGQATAYFKKWGEIKDSLQSLTSQQQLHDMEKLYISEKTKNEEITAKNEELIASKKTQFALGLSLLIILLLAGGTVYFIRFKAQKEREKLRLQIKGTQLKQMLIAQENERKRLARELHDGIGQSLAALKMQLQMAGDNRTSQRTITKVNELCREIRTLSHQMMPLILEENGLSEAMEWLVEQSFGGTNIQVDMVTPRSSQRLKPEIETHLFRVAQELFSNIIKHSQATSVGVQLLRPREKVILIVEDNGIGFNPEQIHQGMGLTNMRSRVESIGGKIEFQPQRNEGTYVRIAIPITMESKLTA